LKSMNVNFNIFPGQHNHHIRTPLNQYGQLWSLEWETDFHLQHLLSNLKVFFKKNYIKFRYRLFKTCTNLL
jgi:hypothetical protein